MTVREACVNDLLLNDGEKASRSLNGPWRYELMNIQADAVIGFQLLLEEGEIDLIPGLELFY